MDFKIPLGPHLQTHPSGYSTQQWPGVTSPADLFFHLFFYQGPLDLPQGHESRHLRAPEPESFQRAPRLPAGQRRLPASPGRGVPDHPLRPGGPHLPRRGKRRCSLLCGLRILGSHPGRRGGGYFRYCDLCSSWFACVFLLLRFEY